MISRAKVSDMCPWLGPLRCQSLMLHAFRRRRSVCVVRESLSQGGAYVLSVAGSDVDRDQQSGIFSMGKSEVLGYPLPWK